MSDTPTNPPQPPADTKTVLTNDAIAAAKSLPGLVQNLKAVDPALAEQLTGKALLASKSPWGTLAAGAVTWLASRYGLGWSPEVCSLVGGAAVLIGSFAMRYVTVSPISSLLPKPPTQGPTP